MALRDKEIRQTPVSMLNLNSHFHKNGEWWKTVAISFVVLIASLFSIRAFEDSCFAQAGDSNWILDKELKISKDAETILRQRYPRIENSSDLSKILVSTALKVPTSSLKVEMIDGTWFISGKKAETVSAIDFEGVPLAQIPQLRVITAGWIGQVHSEELRLKTERDITDYIHKHGYREAVARVEVQTSDYTVEYNAKIDINSPCIVSGYLWPEALPNIRIPTLESGELCDESLAATSLDEIERRFHEKGWIQANLSFGGFSDSKGKQLAYIKVIGTFGEKIEYRFIDSRTNQDAWNQLSSDEIRLMNPSVTSPDAVPYELVNQLKSRGYFEAQVNGPDITYSQGTTIQTFSVTRGQQFFLRALKFEGNQYFSSQDLSGYVKADYVAGGDEANLPAYNPTAISGGIDSIKSAYMKAGFWDAKIIDRQSLDTQNDIKNIQITVAIEEGARRVFGEVVIHGNKNIETSEIESLWDIDKGTPFDRSDLINLQQKVRSLYAEKGYFYATVNIDLLPIKTELNEIELRLTVTVEEGVRVRFGDIFVTGLLRTQQKIVTRELLFETGDWYDPALVSASRRALLRIGVFSSAVITLLDPLSVSEKSEMLDVLVDVKEAPSKTISFGPGWSSFYGMRYNLEGSLTNIGGVGRQVFSRATFNQEKSQNAIGNRTLIGRSIGVGYLEPHILDSQIDGTVSLNQGARSTDYAWALTRGGEVEFSHTLRTLVPGSKIGIFYGKRLSEEESENSVKDAFLADTFSLGHVGLRFNIDFRDDLTWPTDGYTLNSELSWARYELGGDVRYFRWELGNNHYFSLTDRLVFATGFNLSAFQNVSRKSVADNDILPASERLSTGGADSIRGFRERSLGPLVRRPDVDENNNWNCAFTNSPTGGSRRILFKAELRFRWTDSIATTTFVDSGNASFTQEEESKFEKAFAPTQDDKQINCAEARRISIEDNYGYEITDLATHPEYIWERNFTSAGLALNFLTPIGSINLAYGVPWHEPQSEKCKVDSKYCFSRTPETESWWQKGEVHFNVGAKF